LSYALLPSLDLLHIIILTEVRRGKNEVKSEGKSAGKGESGDEDGGEEESTGKAGARVRVRARVRAKIKGRMGLMRCVDDKGKTKYGPKTVCQYPIAPVAAPYQQCRCVRKGGERRQKEVEEHKRKRWAEV
jgi:hypothetical protein